MNQEKLNQLKTYLKEIQDCMYFESVFGEIEDIANNHIPELIAAYEELLRRGREHGN
jgi:hypothetical protein